MISLRILAKGSETAPFGAVSALLAKDADRLPYKIQQRFFDKRSSKGAFLSFERALDFAARFEGISKKNEKTCVGRALLRAYTHASLELFNEIRRMSPRNYLLHENSSVCTNT